MSNWKAYNYLGNPHTFLHSDITLDFFHLSATFPVYQELLKIHVKGLKFSLQAGRIVCVSSASSYDISSVFFSTLEHEC